MKNMKSCCIFKSSNTTRKITETDLLLAKTFLEVLRRAHREIQPSYHESATYIFSQLLSGETVDNKLLNWVLAAMGWSSPDTLYYLICFQVMDQKGNAKSMLLQLERSIPGSKMLIHEDLPVMLLSMPLFERFSKDLLYITKKWHLKCGISMAFNDWNNLSIYFYQASTLLHIIGNDSQLHFCQDHVLHFLREDLKCSVISKHLLHPAIRVLRDYDADNGTELVSTLYCFLLCERSSTMTAKTLNIHRNTLQYRIRRIQDLCDLNLDDPDIRLHLLLTCMIN